MLEQRGQFCELVAFAGVNEKRGAREIAFAGSVELGEDRNQLDGKIVDAIEAHVLEGMQDGAFAGAGQAGENDELAGFGDGKRGGRTACVLHGSATRAQFFTRR